MDRLAGDIIGLPVVTLDGGVTVAHVEDMIVDPSRRQVLALVVQERAFARPARAIPFGRIAATGPDAVLVQHVKVSLEIDRDPVLKGLDNAHKVQGATVMADTGRKLGTVGDMLIDDHTGEIKSYEIVVGDGEKQSLPGDGVVNLGRDYMYVTTAAAESLGQKATRVIDLNGGDEDGGAAGQPPLTGSKRGGKLSPADDPALTASPAESSPAASVPVISGFSTMIGGNTMNMRLVLGIVILVLGILILVYPTLLPLIAGISLIVLGLWIALQNSAMGSRS
jgi:uncharacterized protein YrrD